MSSNRHNLINIKQTKITNEETTKTVVQFEKLEKDNAKIIPVKGASFRQENILTIPIRTNNVI